MPPGGQNPLIAAFEDSFARGDHAEAERVARADFERSGRLVARRLLIKALAAQDRHEEVLELTQQGLADHPDDQGLLQRAQKAARMLRQPGLALEYLERLATLVPDKPRIRFLMGDIHLKAFRATAALACFADALRLGMPRETVLPQLALAAERARRFEDAISFWEDLAQRNLVTEAALQEAIKRIGYLSRLERPDIGTIEDIFALRSDEEGKAASLATEAGDIAVWRRSDSDVAVLLFAGLPWMMGSAPPANRAPLDVLGVNVIAFTDPTQRLCLRGLPSLGENVDDCASRLRDLFKAWGIRRVYALGYSAAGRTALRYAAAVGAERLLLFAGWLDIPPDFTVMLGEHLKATLGEREAEPRPLLEAAGDALQVTMVYGSDAPRDVWQAQLVADLPNVTLRPLPGVSDHILTGYPVHAEMVAELVGLPLPDHSHSMVPGGLEVTS